MKITTKQTIEVEKEIKLPIFLKRVTGSYYGLLSDDNAIKFDSVSIEKTITNVVVQWIGDSDTVEITAEEFTTAFDNTLEQIQQLKSQFFTK